MKSSDFISIFTNVFWLFDWWFKKNASVQGCQLEMVNLRCRISRQLDLAQMQTSQSIFQTGSGTLWAAIQDIQEWFKNWMFFLQIFARVQILHQMLTVVIALALGNFDRLVHFVLEGLFATLSWCASAASIINRSTAYRCTFRQRPWEPAWHGIGSNLMLL